MAVIVNCFIVPTDVLYFTIVLFVASNQVESLNQTKETIVRQLWLISLTNPSVIPLIKVLESVKLKLTGKELFTIDKTMFLNMFSSLVTFSILFAQITGVHIA